MGCRPLKVGTTSSTVTTTRLAASAASFCTPMMPSMRTSPCGARLLRVDEGDVGTVRGDRSEHLAGEGIGDRFDLGIDARQLGALVAAEHRHRQAAGAGLVGLGHRRMRVLDGFDGARVIVLDGVAHAAQEADARVAGVGEDHFPREAHADHLVVDDVGRHAEEREVADTLADRLVGGSVRNEVGEALEGDGVAGVKVSGDCIAEREEFGHCGASLRLGIKSPPPDDKK